jgi:NADPH:quinone reductase-like Zn-dependent oxidoreductase
MIGIASEPSADEAKRHRVRSTFFIVEPDGPELAHLAKLAEAGQLTTTASQVFSLDQAEEAFEVLDHHHARGKLVLTIR